MVLIKRNLFSIIVIVTLAAAALFFVVLFAIFFAKDIRTSKEIITKSDRIDAFVKKSKMPLTEESVSFLEDERNKLKSAYSRLKLALTSPLSDGTSAENIDSLQFKEKLIQTQKKLREEANNSSLALPDSIGFTKYETELSTPAEIPYLLKKLKVLEELVYLMTLSGVVSLNEINFIGEDVKKTETIAQPAAVQAAPMPAMPPMQIMHPVMPQPKDAPEIKPIEVKQVKANEEITISFKITCTYSKLVNFLYRLRVSPFVFVIDDLDITKTKDTADKDAVAESMLQASFWVRAEIIN